MSNPPNPAWSSGINERGIPWLTLDGRQVHSTMDPAKEARRSLLSPEIQNADLLVIYGSGMGWLLEELYQSDPGRRILIMEPDSTLARRARDLRPASTAVQAWADHLRTVFSWDEWQVVSLLQESACRKPALLANPAFKAAFPTEFASLQTGIAKFIQRSQVNSNTLKRFGKLWVRNFCRNRPALPEAGSLHDLDGKYQGMPGMVLAGGPGLDEVLPHLAALKSRMVLVAVDTSLRACLRQGVDPDFVVTVDPQYWNSRHLDWTGESRARVITESSIYPRSLRQTGGPLYFCSSFFPLAGWYEEKLGRDFGKLGAGGSVATSAWDLLRILGCSESWIAGLDLSCPGGKTHFHGALFEEQTHLTASRLEPADQSRFFYLHNDAAFACPTEDGGLVMTDHRMDIYVQWFENQAALYPERVQKRTGQGNRTIRGLSRCPVEEALALPILGNRKVVIDQQISLTGAGTGTHETAADLALRQADDKLASLLQEISDLADRALDLSHRLKALHGNKTPDNQGALDFLLEELDRIDQKLMANPDSRIPGFLMEAQIMDILKAGSPEDHGISAGIKLYQALREVSDYHRKLFAPRQA